MTTKALPGGTAHRLPADFRKAIESNPKVRKLWLEITPLARNEWICWVISVKQEETRTKHIHIGLSKMRGGMRRPCCWSGCPHRADKSISPSQKFVYGKRARK
ncbi:MAG: YdeI/OmpD-associated family protein [Minisyncoccia bacterium]